MLLCQFFCVCVCVKQCVFKIKKKKKKKLETMCWKNQPKKTMHKTMNFGLTNWLNQKRNLGIQQNVTISLFLAMVGSSLIFYYFIF